MLGLTRKLYLIKCLKAIARTAGGQTFLEGALLAMVANRLCQPESKLGVWDRWLSTVYLPSRQELKLRQLYKGIDLLHANIEKEEKINFFNTANLFNLDVDLIFYDNTFASFHVDSEDEDIDSNSDMRKCGHAKRGSLAPQLG